MPVVLGVSGGWALFDGVDRPLTGPKFDQADVGPNKGDQGSDLDDARFFWRRFWSRSRLNRSGADRVGKCEIGPVAKIGAEKHGASSISEP